MTDRLDRIEALLDRIARENDRQFAQFDARLDRINRQIAENSSAIGELLVD